MEKLSEKFGQLLEAIRQCEQTYDASQFYEGYNNSSFRKNCSEENKVRIKELKQSLEAIKQVCTDQKAVHEFREENARISGILERIEGRLFHDIIEPVSRLVEKGEWAEILSKLNTQHSTVIAKNLRQVEKMAEVIPEPVPPVPQAPKKEPEPAARIQNCW